LVQSPLTLALSPLRGERELKERKRVTESRCNLLRSAGLILPGYLRDTVYDPFHSAGAVARLFAASALIVYEEIRSITLE
jgi:hypothetical protein